VDDIKKEQNTSAEELYRRYIEGDDNSFEELVILFHDELSDFIFGIVKDHHEAKHLTIEAFANLAVGGKRFSGKSSLKTYLFAIGKNLSKRYLKMRRNEQHLSFNELEGMVFDSSVTPDVHVIKSEDLQLFYAAMDALKDEYRTVIDLLYFRDMSYIEAGSIMKKSVKQITNLAHRAKTALKKQIEILESSSS